MLRNEMNQNSHSRPTHVVAED